MYNCVPFTKTHSNACAVILRPKTHINIVCLCAKVEKKVPKKVSSLNCQKISFQPDCPVYQIMIRYIFVIYHSYYLLITKYRHII